MTKNRGLLRKSVSCVTAGAILSLSPSGAGMANDVLVLLITGRLRNAPLELVLSTYGFLRPEGSLAHLV